MRPEPGQVLHFSEDPTITRFTPRPSPRLAAAYVWAVGSRRCPDYWFPRECPRAMAWIEPHTTDADRDRILGPGGGHRVHAVEFGWLEAMRTVELYGYRLPANAFRPLDESDSAANGSPALVAVEAVTPLGPPERVGDLFALHAEAGIQLRVLDNLRTFWDAVIDSSLGFSGIRLRNAKPAPA
ncbi:DUF6886 family protein [Stackebrandtia nassauensis]|uniref:Uncharacterized protein n=1 Tax=Stackebrandtia nassauensis (strain DSM 44728 / CIP 108903 / NRRL B-16338 / NBRC 102104 / LLR-40K-21) TaxID=446470 RepID=D3Q504_STANL|nr:DUF6886 family protein [Stackebrandtia nassauensis]ADD42184.1 conserved hypothetical protein [Stackebrandtia nassauensis DSM 44728]